MFCCWIVVKIRLQPLTKGFSLHSFIKVKSKLTWVSPTPVSFLLVSGAQKTRLTERVF